MQVANIQSFSFNGIKTPANFNPTATQEKMIGTIKDILTKDTSVFRKGKNFHDYLESKGEHFLLSGGDYKDEIKIQLGKIRNKDFFPEYNLGSYPENRLDNIVQQLKDNRKEMVSFEAQKLITMIILGVGIIGMALLEISGRK